MSNPFDWVVDRFEREFGCAGVKAECRPLAGEVWLTRYLPDPTPAMAALAATLMAEQTESDLGLFITIKPASWA